MAIRDIIIVPDQRLKLVSDPIAAITSDIRTLAQDMLETMYKAPGIGLAAIQLAIPLRLVVLDVARQDQPPEPLVLINPEILSLSAETRLYEEGCLSVPEVYAEIERPAACTLRYLSLDGETIERECKGLLATCVQHEIDHLDGVLFTDHLSRLKRERVMKKYQKLQKQNA